MALAFGVMLWTLKPFAFRFDGEAPQKHLHYMEHCRGSWTCLAESQRGVCPLFQCSFCLQGLGPFGGPCAPWEAHVLTFLKQPGSLFGAFWGHFGRLWLPVATFQAHLAPEAPENEHYAKNGFKMGALFGSLLVALGTLGSAGRPLEQKWCPKLPKVGICGFCENDCFP